MPQRHLDQLSSTDAKFLLQEDGKPSHMHIGGLAIFEGEPPTYDAVLEHVRSRLPLVPRYRQRLESPPLSSGRPLWVDDSDFNLPFHVRRTGLPAPGGRQQLLDLSARVMGQRLDRSRPLWEMWVVEGLEDADHEGHRGFALLVKSHHAMVDGVGGVDILTALFDLSPDVREVPDDGWRPGTRVGSTELLLRAGVGAARSGAALASSVADLVRHPEQAGRRAVAGVAGLGEVLWQLVDPAPPTPINQRIGPHRRVALVRRDLAEFKEIKDALGGTVNDVMITAVTGALRGLLTDRAVSTDGLTMRAMVPVSIRGGSGAGGAGDGALGNQITAMVAQLPVGIADPVERLGTVKEGLAELKSSNKVLGAQLMTAMEEFAPPTVLARASRLSFSPRLYNLIVTNVPGPQFPIWFLGRQMREIYPLGFLSEDHALIVAILSYDGGVYIGLLGDYDVLPDLDAFAGHLEVALDELLDAAR